MNKSIYALFAFLICAVFGFTSCSDDNNDDSAIQEWKAYNEQQIKDVKSTGLYETLESETGNGAVLWRNVNNIQSAPAVNPEPGSPIFTDSVVCRYIGWYLDLNGKKVIFDQTEDGANAQAGRGFRLNSVIPGWATMLQIMTVDQEVEFVLPYALGYGNVGSNNGAVGILPYTTLRFDMKLLKIIRWGSNQN